MTNLLVWLLAIPLIGAIVCALLPGRVARTWSLGVALLTLVIGLLIWSRFDFDNPAAFQMAYGGAGSLFSFPAIGFSFTLGIDTISLWLVLLTVLLQPLAIAASFGSIKEREKEYYAWMLALLVAMLGVFVARDLLLFYVFFELTLIPMFFIIGLWGGPERRRAAGKFFLFTFAGSVFTLAGVIYLGLKASTFDIAAVMQFAQTRLSSDERFWLFWSFLAGFAVKVPLFPVHTWLPLAHTEAPTAGSVILAGVLLKLGTYGLMRLAIPVGLPDVTYQMAGTLGVLCIIGIIYGALVAWVQQDIKKLVAYSSVSHLGFCVLGLLAMNDVGMESSVLYMINHGLNTGALFLVIGMIYDRYHTRDINQLSGLARVMPKLAFFFIFFTLASIGLPGLNGFVSEFLTILGAFTSEHLGIAYGVLASLGIILGAVYMLHMAARVIWGPLKTPDVHHGHHQEDQGQAATPDHGHDAHALASHGHGAHGHAIASNDIGFRETAILVPLAVLVIVLGVYPTPVLKSMEAPVNQIRQAAVTTEQPLAQAQAPVMDNQR